jgi:hypothetical protein
MSSWTVIRVLLVAFTPSLLLGLLFWGADLWHGRRDELSGPRHGHGRHHDRATFNDAVVTYVWGDPPQAEPGDHRDAVPDELFELVAHYLELAYRTPDWTRDSAEDAAALIERELLRRHVELTPDAAASLAAWAVHAWTTWPGNPGGSAVREA